MAWIGVSFAIGGFRRMLNANKDDAVTGEPGLDDGAKGGAAKGDSGKDDSPSI